ncbi:MAG: hypothetical protein WC728_13445 [Elusimicrobiota bacterium]
MGVPIMKMMTYDGSFRSMNDANTRFFAALVNDEDLFKQAVEKAKDKRRKRLLSAGACVVLAGAGLFVYAARRKSSS